MMQGRRRFDRLFKFILIMGFTGAISSGAAPVRKEKTNSYDSSAASLQGLLHGATLYLSGKAAGKNFFRINDLILDTTVENLYLSGTDIYYTGADPQVPYQQAPGYFKSGQFHNLDLKKDFHLEDLRRSDTVLYLLGWDRDSITQKGSTFVFQNGKKGYLQTAMPPHDSLFLGEKLLVDKDDIWMAGIIGDDSRKAALWKNAALMKILPADSGTTDRILGIFPYRGNILFAGISSYPYDDFLVAGGWYWYAGIRHPIKYFEDGDDANPNDFLRVNQFIISGDSLLAVGDPPFFGAPSFLWVNGVATAWKDSTVYHPQLLGIASCQGILYLLGQYQRDTVSFQENVLCLWSQPGVLTWTIQ